MINGPLDALHGEMVSVGTMIVLREYKRVARAIREEDAVSAHNGKMTRNFLRRLLEAEAF